MSRTILRWLAVLLVALVAACGIKLTLEEQHKVTIEGPKHTPEKTPEQEKEDTPESP